MNNLFKRSLGGLAVGLGAALSSFAVHAQAQVMTPDQIDARYDAARKQCDSMTGDQKETCLMQARTDRLNAQADAKAGKEKAEADRDASRTKRDANYDLAIKKCDAMSGDAEDKCRADAKTQFGK